MSISENSSPLTEVAQELSATAAAIQMPGLWKRTIGALTLTYIPDAGVATIPLHVYPRSVGADWPNHTVHMNGQGHLPMGCGALLVERGTTRMLIDAGHGRISGDIEYEFQHAFEHVSSLPDNLTKIGLTPGDIPMIAFTHMHGDHTGWARPDATDTGTIFENARWLVGEKEFADGSSVGDSPLAEARDRITTVADGEEIAEGIRAWSLPGHSPGHTAWVLDAGDGREVVAFGDALHSPVQFEHLDWEFCLDADPAQAERSRVQLAQHLSRGDVLGFGVHFGDRQLGTVDERGLWRPEPLSN